MIPRYSVTVGNIGTVLNTDSSVDAFYCFLEYKDDPPGRAEGSVVLWHKGEPINEYVFPVDW